MVRIMYIMLNSVHIGRQLIGRALPFIVISAICPVAPVLAAPWSIQHLDASTTGAACAAARTENEAGHSLSIYRECDGKAVWLKFSLAATSKYRLSSELAPMYRIDKHHPKDLNVIKMAARSGRFAVWPFALDSTSVAFVLWHGDEKLGLAEELVRLLQGQIIRFRFYLPDNSYKETLFALDGAADVIGAALGISSTVDPDSQARGRQLRQAHTAAFSACDRALPIFRQCIEKVSRCATDSPDLESFQSCN